MNTLEKIIWEDLKQNLPIFKAGDSVKVHTRIKEGDKERIQIFEGVIIRRKGHGREASFTVRKMSYGVGVERIFPLHSPYVEKIDVVARGKVRRAKLYYLRNLSGRKARIVSEENFRGATSESKNSKAANNTANNQAVGGEAAGADTSNIPTA